MSTSWKTICRLADALRGVGIYYHVVQAGRHPHCRYLVYQRTAICGVSGLDFVGTFSPYKLCRFFSNQLERIGA